MSPKLVITPEIDSFIKENKTRSGAKLSTDILESFNVEISAQGVNKHKKTFETSKVETKKEVQKPKKKTETKNKKVETKTLTCFICGNDFNERTDFYFVVESGGKKICCNGDEYFDWLEKQQKYPVEFKLETKKENGNQKEELETKMQKIVSKIDLLFRVQKAKGAVYITVDDRKQMSKDLAEDLIAFVGGSN